MNLQSLKPAGQYAVASGVKAIIYGPAGSGKTPILNTAPRPILLACEPGLLSMKGSTIPTFVAPTSKLIDEFFDWLFSSNEVKNFDTIAIDSVSEICNIYLDEELTGKTKSGNKAHGLAAYGNMAEACLKHLDKLFHMPQKHTYLIAKLDVIQFNNMSYKRPFYPGREMPREMAHKYDAVLYLDKHNIPNVGQQTAFRCHGTIDTMARDRSGQLAEFEPPHFGQIVAKAMS